VVYDGSREQKASPVLVLARKGNKKLATWDLRLIPSQALYIWFDATKRLWMSAIIFRIYRDRDLFSFA
jgi:hypothetical protein